MQSIFNNCVYIFLNFKFITKRPFGVIPLIRAPLPLSDLYYLYCCRYAKKSDRKMDGDGPKKTFSLLKLKGGLSKRKAAKQYNIPFTTLRDRLKKPVFTQQQETEDN